jgi:hypothetical protein
MFHLFYYTATPLCSRTTSNLRYCSPYAAEASPARVYVRKGSNKSKLVTKAKKTTKSTTKTPAMMKKQLKAKKYAPVLRQTKKA